MCGQIMQTDINIIVTVFINYYLLTLVLLLI